MTTSHQIKRVQQAICCPGDNGCENPDDCIHLQFRDEARAVLALPELFGVPVFDADKFRKYLKDNDITGAPV